MLWLEKYRPGSFDEVTTHRDIVSILQKYTLDTVPNLVFHGQPGHNRRTLLEALVGHLYGKKADLKKKTIELQINATSLTVSYLESEEMVVISPSGYGNKDRHVVQHIIKEMAQTRPILSLFGAKKHSIKIIVINQAETLSRDAQAALRRTMEVYSSHFRIFMVCTEVSRLMEPIRSRALFVRVRGFTDEEIIDICANVIAKEGYTMDDALLSEAASNAAGNAQRALCICELYCLNNDEKGVKRTKCDLKNFKLNWESQIESLVTLISAQPRVEKFAKIRQELYAILTAAIPPSIILLEIARRLSRTGSKLSTHIIKAALLYDERIKMGTKHLLHLEAFAATAMCLYEKKAKA